MPDNPLPQQGPHPTALRRLGVRWHWYHYYLLLALFDIIVILVSLVVYHRTASSYRAVLRDLRMIDKKLRWVGDLRSRVVRVNGPGNKVIKHGHVDDERVRFERRETKLRKTLQRQADLGVDLRDFRAYVDEMVEDEKRLFATLGPSGDGRAARIEAARLREAAVLMSSMNRDQARALATLEQIAESLSSDRYHLLRAYGKGIKRGVVIERYLFGTVFLILMGAFFYARKLQRTHEQMIIEHQRMIEERHARMAEVGEVCAGVAHGIRNPLAGIMSSAQLALEFDNLDETASSRLKDILNESKRLDYRINRLLYFSTARSRPFEPCDLGQVVRDALSEVKHRLDANGVTLVTDLPDERLIVNGDRESLAQSIIEIASNSVDHLPGGGTIHIACRRDGDDPRQARIDMTDDGPGIPKSIQPYVFNLFFTSRADGNGIGLASVKRTVEYHGGRVRVAQTDHVGAHIEIILPLAESP